MNPQKFPCCVLRNSHKNSTNCSTRSKSKTNTLLESQNATYYPYNNVDKKYRAVGKGSVIIAKNIK